MIAGVLHSIWLHGRYRGSQTCRAVLTTGFCNALGMARDGERVYLEEFLSTPEADEPVSTVMARYGSRAEKE